MRKGKKPAGHAVTRRTLVALALAFPLLAFNSGCHREDRASPQAASAPVDMQGDSSSFNHGIAFVKGHAQISDGLVTLKGDEIDYDSARRTATVKGNASCATTTETQNADTIVYDFTIHKATASGNAKITVPHRPDQ